MTDPTPGGKTNSKWLWILILALLFILLLAWFRDPLGDVEEAPPAAQETPSDEWTTAPEEPGVPVTLPTTDLAPAEPAPTGGEGSSSGAGE